MTLYVIEEKYNKVKSITIYQKMINLSEQEIENETIKSYAGLYMLLESFRKANSEGEEVSETEDE